ncbi:MAG: NAD+ synthase, partial [Opitutae bacterium]|nr:NAD+ synthase [Opitutae bacterium]
MRIGLAQINTIVGDLPGNRRRILDAYRTLVAQGAKLVLFPELAVCGYPPRDLLFKKRFVPDVEQTTREIAAEIGAVPALIGYTESNPSGRGRPAFNAAAFCQSGKIAASARKCLLPTYDVFDEDRYFEPVNEPLVVSIGGRQVGVTICEDIWTHPMISTHRLYNGLDPVKQLAARKVDLLVNLSASPWNAGKGDVRHTLVADVARACRCPAVYCNSIGGNDELLFDGRSVVCDAKGRVIAGLAAFREELRVVAVGRVVPTSRPAAPAHPEDSPSLHPTFHQEDLADIYDALVLGVRDYAHKTGFTKALLGLSGGIDSALTA